MVYAKYMQNMDEETKVTDQPAFSIKKCWDGGNGVPNGRALDIFKARWS